MITKVDKIPVKGAVLVDFYSPTCVPCKVMERVLEEIDAQVLKTRAGERLNIVKIDVTEGIEAQRCGVMSVPTLVYLVNNIVKESVVGFPGKTALDKRVSRWLSV